MRTVMRFCLHLELDLVFWLQTLTYNLMLNVPFGYFSDLMRKQRSANLLHKSLFVIVAGSCLR